MARRFKRAVVGILTAFLLATSLVALNPAVPAANAACDPLPQRTKFQAQARVQGMGWHGVHSVSCYGEVFKIGTVGKSLNLESFRAQFIVRDGAGSFWVDGRAYFPNRGWEQERWVKLDAGSSWYRDRVTQWGAKGRRMESFRLYRPDYSLGPSGTGKSRICYQAHVQNKGWRPWRCQGQSAGDASQHLRIEAIRFKVVRA